MPTQHNMQCIKNAFTYTKYLQPGAIAFTPRHYAKYSYMLALLTALVLLFAGCKNKDLLDIRNPAGYDPEGVWNDPSLANAYLVDIYASLPGWPVNDGDKADEGVSILTTSSVNPNNSDYKYWPYTTIRKINVMLQDIDGGTLAAATKEALKGQAFFLRAFHYFKAVVYHGGVPVIKTPQSLSDSLSVPRNSTKECFEFILSDLDSALSRLPDQYKGSDYGRIDKAAATAFRGRVMLYMASPQFNPASPYDNAYWQDAYTATKAAKTMLDGLGYALYPDYGGIWMNEQNAEDVMTVIYKNPGKTNGRQEHCVRPLSQSKDCTGSDNPIWNLVMSYPMKDGMAPGSSPKYSYDVQTFWENRDPRFDATIAYNGSLLPLGVSADRKQFTDLQVGGLDDGFGPGENFGRTGFYCRKGIDNSLAQAQAQLNAVDWVEIRFAEVLLNFAEAANETGHSDEALEVLKDIRSRAGIEAGVNNMYGLAANMDRTAMRDAIMKERYLEFTFEGKRFWDLRRTRRLSMLDGIHKYGLMATLKAGKDPSAGNSLEPADFTYTVTELITSGPKTVSAPESFFLLPRSQDEIQKNPMLDQNKDWGGSFDPTLH